VLISFTVWLICGGNLSALLTSSKLESHDRPAKAAVLALFAGAH